MAKTTVHIINHTHWDREWFLTSVYTTQWIPGLIDRLEEIVARMQETGSTAVSSLATRW